MPPATPPTAGSSPSAWRKICASTPATSEMFMAKMQAGQQIGPGHEGLTLLNFTPA